MTRRVVFTVGGEEASDVLNRTVAFDGLLIESCRSVTLHPERLEVATGDGDWQQVATGGEVRILCRDPDARVALRKTDPSQGTALGTLGRLRAQPGSQVVLAAHSGNAVDVTVEVETPQSFTVPIHGNVEIVTEFVELEGVEAPVDGDLLRWRAELKEAYKTLTVESGDDGLALVLTPAASSSGAVFTENATPLAAVQLLYESLEGDLQTPLLADATLAYPDFPGVAAVTLAEADLVGLDELEDFRLEGVTLDDETGGLKLRFDGVVGELGSTDGVFHTDRRLTLMERLYHSKRWSLAAVAGVWLLTTTFGVYSTLRKLGEADAG
jgi:hypothetical protein